VKATISLKEKQDRLIVNVKLRVTAGVRVVALWRTASLCRSRSDLKIPKFRAYSVRRLTILVQPVSVLGEGIRVSWLEVNHVPQELACCGTSRDSRQNSKGRRVRRIQRHASSQHLDALLGSVRPPESQTFRV